MENEFFSSRDNDRIWQRYCGFLDLSVKEFMEIQENLLMEQIDLVSDSPLGKIIMKNIKPKDIDEFRETVPLTSYQDYSPYLDNNQEEYLSEKPYCWGRTSGRGGTAKWVPYTEKSMDWVGRLGVAMLILACASRKGDVRIGPGVRVLQNLPPRPYYTGIGAAAMIKQLDMRMIPPVDKYEEESFEKRIQDGFLMALRDGVDVLGSLTTVLIRMGERFSGDTGGITLSRKILHPRILLRLTRAYLKSKKERRKMLPRDIWPLKGLICYGMDTSIYRDELIYYWGKEPLELYGGTEVGLLAIQAWNKKGMTFFPFYGFFEFIPEEEWLKNTEDENYQPFTILLDEVKAGEKYELVVTNFYGMPFLRYRIGDLIKITALEDEETGVRIPQMTFEGRADDLISIAGFTRLDEKTIWRSMVNTGVKYEEWTARKEYELEKPILHMYIELKESIDVNRMLELLHAEFRAIDEDYRNLEDMLGICPLKVTLLPEGSFQHYYQQKQESGADLAHLKPRHINPSEDEVKLLLTLTMNKQGG
ncbi:MAG: GH3 auxin-responsive promoter family protein [Dehalococcoidales bacterium]|nr:GH3 auxin-responsive promoter family protein [Dehalococcoidales bacterium]